MCEKWCIIAQGFRSGVEPPPINFGAVSPGKEEHVLTPQAVLAQDTIYMIYVS